MVIERFGDVMIVKAEEGMLLRQVNTPWNKLKVMVINKFTLKYVEEVPLTPVTESGQYLFGFMEG